MKVTRVHSKCECQVNLCAELDEARTVLRGWAVDWRKVELPAPANAIGAQRERFDVGWACPFCTRNTLRSFTASALTFRDPEADQSAPPNAGG